MEDGEKALQNGRRRRVIGIRMFYVRGIEREVETCDST